MWSRQSSVNLLTFTFQFTSNRKYYEELGVKLTTNKNTAVAAAKSQISDRKRQEAEAQSARMEVEHEAIQADLMKQHQEALEK